MNRWLMTAVLAACLTGMVAAQDRVYYWDRVAKKKKPDEVVGKIEEEGPKGIKIRDSKKNVVKEIPTNDIDEVHYNVLPEVTWLVFRRPFGKEKSGRDKTGKARTRDLEDALEGYTKLEGDVRGHPNARRYLQYKIAAVTVLMAQDDPTKKDLAIKRLTDFTSAHPTSWAIVPALKTVARLQEEAGKTDDARKSYEQLAEIPGVPRELKQESEILVGRLLLRGHKFGDAQQRLEKLAASMAAGDAQKPFVDAYLAESKIGQDKLTGVDKALAGVIRASTDARLRGVAYNLLGDYYRK
jgi:hypothetical protein